MFPVKHFVEAGGLMSYGLDTAARVRRVASQMDMILKGAKPSDIEQSTNSSW